MVASLALWAGLRFNTLTLIGCLHLVLARSTGFAFLPSALPLAHAASPSHGSCRGAGDLVASQQNLGWICASGSTQCRPAFCNEIVDSRTVSPVRARLAARLSSPHST